MAIIRINELPEGSGNLTSDDLFVFMDNPLSSGVTKKVSLTELANVIGSGNILLEQVQDNLANSFLIPGSGINLYYDDDNNNLLISASGLQDKIYQNPENAPTSIIPVSGNNIVSLAVGNGMYSHIGGGSGNLIGQYGFIGGGTNNNAIGYYQSIIGGANNIIEISHSNSQIIGSNITSINSNTTHVNNLAIMGSGIDPSNMPGKIIFSDSSIQTTAWTGSIDSSQVSDFTSAVSGLIPVKDIIAGTDISIISTSGIYTISSSNSVNTDTLEPDGFINRSDSIIAFDNGSREFSISPKAPATSYGIYNNGVKVIKTTIETITLPNSTALYFLHFDKSDNSLSYKTTGFDFNTDIPIAQVYYNANDSKAVYFGEERHGIRMDAATHKYLHNVFGTQYINGLSISNYSTSGTGSSNSDATIAIGDGLIYDEDIEASISHSDSPVNPFEQVLYPIAQIPVYYKVGASGIWTDTTPTDYPVKTGTTIQYNLDSAGTWSASDSPNPTNNRYIAYWICATTQENAPVISIMGQRIDSSLEQATSNNAWGNLNLTGLPIVELRPLYRLIYDTQSTFANSPKGFLVDVLDIRSHIDTVTGLTQNDHGNLYGLADDDHYQYVHIDNARTIDAVHTFANGLLLGDPEDPDASIVPATQTLSLSALTINLVCDSLKKNTAEIATVSYKVDLGTITTSTAIDYSSSPPLGGSREIQTLTLNGTAVSFTKGNYWPGVGSSLSVDVLLKITVSSPTSITWTIVNEWYNQAPAGALAVGTHLFLLRAVGTTIEGHYIGYKTAP